MRSMYAIAFKARCKAAPQGHFMKLMAFTECHLEALCEPQLVSVGYSQGGLKKVSQRANFETAI